MERLRAAIVTHERGPARSSRQLKLVESADPFPGHMAASAFGSFHLGIPSIPGYGYSGKPTANGMGFPARIARAGVRVFPRLVGPSKLWREAGLGAVITDHVTGVPALRNG